MDLCAFRIYPIQRITCDLKLFHSKQNKCETNTDTV